MAATQQSLILIQITTSLTAVDGELAGPSPDRSFPLRYEAFGLAPAKFSSLMVINTYFVSGQSSNGKVVVVSLGHSPNQIRLFFPTTGSK